MKEFNFLPKKYSQKLKGDILAHLLYAFSLAGFLWLLVFGIVIFSGVQFLDIQNKALINRVEKLNALEEVAEAKNIENQIKDLNILLARIEDIRKENIYDPVGILQNIIPLIPEGIELEEFRFHSKTGKVFLSGYANLRTQVKALENSLEENKMFSSIESPLSNFLKSEDINFQFTLTLLNSENESN